MEKIVFAIIFPLLFCTFQSLINKSDLRRTVKSIEETSDSSLPFCVEYPKSIGIIGILNMIIGAIIIAVAVREMGDIHWAILVPFALMLVGFCLFLKTFYWRMYVGNDFITLVSPFRKPYTFSIADIVLVKRECKDTYNNTKERILISTPRIKKICIENSAVYYPLLKAKLIQDLNCRVLWGF